MTEVPPPDETAAAPPPRPRRSVPRRWKGRLALPLAALSCAFSALALIIAIAGTAPPVTTAAHAAVTPWSEVPRLEAPLAPDSARQLVAIELLMPQLRRAAPFPRAFAVAIALASGDAEATRLLMTLAAAAAEGAPTIRDLVASFGPVAEAAVLAELGFAPDAGWLARRIAGTMRLGAAVGAAGTPALAALRDAAEELAAGRPDAAEARLATLSGPTAEALATWRGGLARRIAADAAAAQLAALSIARAQETPR
jgi:hypothetical protein